MALPSTDNLKYLSSLYEVPVDYLLKEDSEMKNNPDNEPTPDKIQSKRKKAVNYSHCFYRYFSRWYIWVFSDVQ